MFGTCITVFSVLVSEEKLYYRHSQTVFSCCVWNGQNISLLGCLDYTHSAPKINICYSSFLASMAVTYLQSRITFFCCDVIHFLSEGSLTKAPNSSELISMRSSLKGAQRSTWISKSQLRCNEVQKQSQITNIFYDFFLAWQLS